MGKRCKKCRELKGVAGRGSRTKGRRGGVRPKAEKKKSDFHQFEGGNGQRCACCIFGCFQWGSDFEMSPSESAHTTNSHAKFFRRTSVDDDAFEADGPDVQT